MRISSSVGAIFVAAFLATLLIAPPVQAAQSIAISTPGEAAGQTLEPQGVAVDQETGRLYVADRGNRRVDVFAEDGSFLMAWGWGVADGKAELETCTVTCRKGLAGGGAGEFTVMSGIAVDNSEGPSKHDVYVLDGTGESRKVPLDVRVEKFDPQGNFLLTFGGGVVTGGAKGAGELTAGSMIVEHAKATQGNFAVGQVVTGPGIPSGTTIVAVGQTSLTLSAAAETSAVSAPLSVAEGTGHIPVNETQKVTQATSGVVKRGFNLAVQTPGPSPETARTGGEGSGELASLSPTVNNVETTSGQFLVGESLFIPEGGSNLIKEDTKIAALNLGAKRMTLSQPTEAGSAGTVDLESALAPDGSAELVQRALEALPNIGTGNVSVSGPAGGPYDVEFSGPRLGDANIPLLDASGSSSVLVTAVQKGGGAAEVCTAADAESCTGGVEGEGPGQFGRFVQLAIGPNGSVYVADVRPVEENSAGTVVRYGYRVQEFQPSGTFVRQVALGEGPGALGGFGVDADSDFHLSANDELATYGSSGNLLTSSSTAGTAPLAIAEGGELFTSEGEPILGLNGRANPVVITEYGLDGAASRRFGYNVSTTPLPGLAAFASQSGVLYVSTGDTVRLLQAEPPGPVVFPCEAEPHNVRATLGAPVNPEGSATRFYVEYVKAAEFAASGFATATRVPSDPGDDPTLAAGTTLQLASLDAMGLVPETTYYCRTVAENTEGVTVGAEAAFETLEPFELGEAWATKVGTETAVVTGEVNPLGAPTDGYFEYVSAAEFNRQPPGHGFDHAGRAPVPPVTLNFGSGEGFEARSAEIGGLSPATEYHYRLVVDDHVVPPRDGKDHTFRTHGGVQAIAPDNRAYELVSPAIKNSADVGTPSAAGGGAGIREAAPNGEAVTFASAISFGEAESAPASSEYIARRTSSGWTTKNLNISGFLGLVGSGALPYQGFSQDLGFGAVSSFEPPLTPDAKEGFETLYWRNTESGSLSAVNTEVPKVTGGEPLCIAFAGSDAAGDRIVFTANASLAGAPKGKGMSLYEWTAAGGTSVVSVLPGGSGAPPGQDTAFGAAGNLNGCKVQNLNFHNVISADGKRIFWTESPKPGEQDLFARVDGSETVQLDADQGGTGKSGGGQFLAASRDGSVVLFTDPNRLTPDSHGPGDLYRYDFNAPEGQRLTDLTPGSEGAEVLGLVASSEDGSYAYFVADGDLAAGGSAGDCTEPGGTCGLYLWHEGEGVRFVATLSERDAGIWASNPQTHGAAATADGKHLVFTTTVALNGSDNTVQGAPGCALSQLEELEGDKHCSEVYLYDQEGSVLSCVSCNPTGQRPRGPSTLPGWTTSTEGPRYLSQSGGRLFFQSRDDLLPADENESQDVYEFERPGTGTCTTASSSFEAESGGCLFLISSGSQEFESPAYLIDASSDGRDVFFSTRKRLVAADKDELYDVYDYREGGGFTEVAEVGPCEGEACKPAASSPPPTQGSATPGFVGPGNGKAATPCKKGKVRKGGKCVPKKPRQKKTNGKKGKKGHRSKKGKPAKNQRHKNRRHKSKPTQKARSASGGHDR
jgi:NHL repeat-containing protein